MKILLGQLAANGDCLYATILARQLKKDYPDSRLTWAVSKSCRHVLDGNPHVDDIWEWDTTHGKTIGTAWRALETAVLRVQSGPEQFDRVVLSQIWPSNFRNFDGTIRPSILRAYDRPISVPIDSTIVLSDREKERVADFVRSNGIDRYEHRILFECSALSGQSYVTPRFALKVAKQVSSQLKNSCFILSTHRKLKTTLPNVFWATEIKIRENAELTHHCSLFVGCGSGVTVAATSGAAEELPNIQLLSSHTSVYASFLHDFQYWGKPSTRFIEMGDASAKQVAGAIVTCCKEGLTAARDKFHNPLPVTFDFYLWFIDRRLVRNGCYVDALKSLTVTAQRYGWDEKLLNFGRKRVVPRIKSDALFMDIEARNKVEALLDGITSA